MNMINDNSLLLGIRRFFPAIKNIAHSIDINTADKATFNGDELPKNSAISLPEEKPAPIIVPMYRNDVFIDFFTQNAMKIATPL